MASGVYLTVAGVPVKKEERWKEIGGRNYRSHELRSDLASRGIRRGRGFSRASWRGDKMMRESGWSRCAASRHTSGFTDHLHRIAPARRPLPRQETNRR